MNNILHLKYAVEVERTGSISKAAENLYMGQPHLSRAIRELEDSIGIAIFRRTSRGVITTEKGRDFLSHAKSILAQINEMENRYKPSADQRQRLDVSVPRAGYIASALADFAASLNVDKKIDINYRETNSTRAIKNIAECINNIAIVRYQAIYENNIICAIEEKDLKSLPLFEFEKIALISSRHPLAKSKSVDISMLSEYTEIVYGDTAVSSAKVRDSKDSEQSRKIEIYERASLYELLRGASAYMLTSPEPLSILERFSLVQKKIELSDIANNVYKDILVYRKGYKFSQEDDLFIKKLKDAILSLKNYYI